MYNQEFNMSIGITPCANYITQLKCIASVYGFNSYNMAIVQYLIWW